MERVPPEGPAAEEHVAWMRRCLELARQALAAGNPPVGAVLVSAGKAIGEGMEATRTRRDITCHAEIEAIRDALQRADGHELRGSTLYSTHEPCLMCAYVIRHYQVSQVIIGTTVPSVGGYSSAYPLLTAADIPVWAAPPRVVTDVLKDAAQALSWLYNQQQRKKD
jgi:tRNA(Arg) A34 adenosine deaminase TadA